MIEEKELIVLILATGMLIIILMNLKRIITLPHYRWLIAGYATVYAGWILTILEGFALNTALNIVEHICYMLSMILVAGWSIRTFVRKGAK